MGTLINKQGSYRLPKRRYRLDIIADVLNFAREEASKSQIMYGTHMNFDMFNMHSKCMLEAKLLDAVRRGARTFYKTTEKGNAFLDRYGEIKKMIFEPGDELDGPLIVKKGSIVCVAKSDAISR